MARNYIIAASALVLAFLASVQAACDNACSGHGVCTYDDRCVCYDNWRMGLEEGGDCSDRVCPFDIAWVDNANKDGRSHRYAECSGRGLCDRASGACSCFEGFEGKSCQRTTCPNDCSGHGRCMYLNEMPVGAVYTDGFDEDVDVRARTLGASMKYWDSEKTRGCVCDATYHGVDCSIRLCPRGTDILDLKRSVYDVDLQVPQIQRIRLSPFKGMSIDDAFGGNTFSLVFRSLLNETFYTAPIYFPSSTVDTAYSTDAGEHYASWDTVTVIGTAPDEKALYGLTTASEDWANSGFAQAIEDALISLPNQVIDDVYVEVSRRLHSVASGNLTAVEYFNIDVTFSGTAVQGPQNLLMVQADSCDVGCTPKLSGLHLQEYVVEVDAYDQIYSSVAELRTSEFNSYECGRRGKCDYNTGICSCFTGYTGESCNVQTALV